jgi:glutamate-5-semialdehyde dehydrogenase
MQNELQNMLDTMAQNARNAYLQLALSSHAQRQQALLAMAAKIAAARDEILAANALDMQQAYAKKLSAALCDRLLLDEARIEAIIKAISEVAKQADPLGRQLDNWQVASNGLQISKVTIPIGVIAMIYEARPNVTADAAALCLASGNAVILRGGSESVNSSRALVQAIRAGLRANEMPEDAVQYIPTQDRAAVDLLLQMYGQIDMVIPRGGKGLTQKVAEQSRIPTLLHLDGNCHSYVHASADLQAAQKVVLNAKMRRTGICGATETLLVDAAIADKFLPEMVAQLTAKNCELRGDAAAQKICPQLITANEDDWYTEYHDAILAIKIVSDVQAAITHINHYGSHHTDAILAQDNAAISAFQNAVDSAIIMVNASTQFADGGEFGFGGEIGIATGRLHARGPVGAAHLTTFKYIVTGDGSVRG